jgi:Na+/H+ antiporter
VEIAFALVALAVVVLFFTGVSERLGFPAPLALTVVGIVGAYLPGVPEIHLGHDVVLFGLLPPLLYAAAMQTSLVDFRANVRPILLLSVGLVIATTLGVAVVVHALLPGLGWPAAFAIGAVVAPPDAVAATAIGRRIGLPRQLVSILEGESLFNDATALVALRTAIAATAGVTALHVGEDFLIAAGGGALVGFVVFLIVAWIRRHLTDPLMDVGLSFVVPFAAYVAAERFHGSGVIAVVIAGLLLGHKAPIIQTAQSRIAERINWRTIAFLLENTVFLLIGLQAKWILEDVADSDVAWGRVLAICVAALTAAIVIRLVWVFATQILLMRRGGPRKPAAYSFILGWAGMRGVVTLAAGFVIPEDTEHREILLLIAFTVVAGTLFLQGLSLPWFVRRLDVPSPDPAADALARASLLQQASKAGFDRLEAVKHDDPHDVIGLIKQRVEQRNFAAWEQLGTKPGVETPSDLYARVRLEMIEAERERVLEVRSERTIPSEVVSQVLTMLDVEESMLDRATETQEGVRTANAFRLAGTGCPEIDSHPAVTPVENPVCQGCLDDGTTWVALRQCLDCGHIGCCDSSPGRHATGHFHDTGHPVMESAEPGETWRWCYLHQITA